MVTFLLILVVLFLLWPTISRWLRGFMARRMEDAMRKMAGMPSRKEEERMRRRKEREGRRKGGGRTERPGARSRRPEPASGGPIIPKEYAEDVEFTEIIDYSEETVIAGDRRGPRREYHESQVSDVRFVEIKDKDKK